MRRPKRWFSVGAVCLAAFTACRSDTTPVPSSPVGGIAIPTTSSKTAYGVFPGSQYGIAFMGNHLNDAYEDKLRAAQTMRAAGVRFARIGAYWYLTQQFHDTTLTPWALTPLHETARALIEAGITPYMTLEATACFARSKPRYGPDDPFCTWEEAHHPPDTEAHWQAWTSYVGQMTREFPEVKYWGIWNEPNVSFLQPDAGGNRLDAYKKLVERASPAIRASGGIVIGPDLADGYDSTTAKEALPWLASFMSTHGSYIDVVAVHLYGSVTNADFVNNMRAYSNVVAGGQDLWLTEVARGIPGTNANDHEQAVNLSAVYRAMDSRAVPKWTKTFYFAAGLFVDPDHNFGLVRDLGKPWQQPRPAYDTLRAIARPIELVEIDGPSSHRPNQTCEFVAQVFDPDVVQPLSYTWAAAGAGGSSQYFYPNSTGITSSYVVSLTVRDPTGRTGTVQRTVKVGTQYLPCPE